MSCFPWHLKDIEDFETIQVLNSSTFFNKSCLPNLIGMKCFRFSLDSTKKIWKLLSLIWLYYCYRIRHLPFAMKWLPNEQSNIDGIRGIVKGYSKSEWKVQVLESRVLSTVSCSQTDDVMLLPALPLNCHHIRLQRRDKLPLTCVEL